METIVISYIPLLEADRAISPDLKKIQKQIESGNGNAKFCMWYRIENVLTAILCYEKGRKVADHFNKWSEGKPEDWFTFAHLSDGEKYVLALIPNLQKSFERNSINVQLETGYPLPKSDIKFFFEPLTFKSRHVSTYDVVVPLLEEKVQVGIVEPKDVDPSNPQNFDSSRVRILGSFTVENSELSDSLLSQMLKDD
jgi:hypothetical protein